MNVGELKKMLEKYPDDMEIIHTMCSDYSLITEEDWSVVSAVDQIGYVMRSHETMSDENKKKQKQYLHLVGK